MKNSRWDPRYIRERCEQHNISEHTDSLIAYHRLGQLLHRLSQDGREEYGSVAVSELVSEEVVTLETIDNVLEEFGGRVFKWARGSGEVSGVRRLVEDASYRRQVRKMYRKEIMPYLKATNTSPSELQYDADTTEIDFPEREEFRDVA